MTDQGGVKQDYETALCGCTDDCAFCLLACCCSCLATGEIMRRLTRPEDPNEPRMCCLGMCGAQIVQSVTGIPCLEQCFYSFMVTPRVSQAVNRQQNVCCDCLIAVFCLPCRITQEELELRKAAEAGRTDLYLKGAPISCCCTAPDGSVSYLAPGEVQTKAGT